MSALSVAPSCLRIQGDGSSAVLRPNPAFMPKVITSSFRSRVITLDGFFPPPHRSEEEATSHLSCPAMWRARLPCAVLSACLCITESARSGSLCLHSGCHTGCVRLYHRHMSPLGWILRRTLMRIPPEEFLPPRLCTEECQWKTFALGLPPVHLFNCI